MRKREKIGKSGRVINNRNSKMKPFVALREKTRHSEYSEETPTLIIIF
jgi:hypothetical protein